MTLHIFNPEHDIALASNLANFTAPHAGRQLRHDLGFLPVLWAWPGDAVLVDDVACAAHAVRRLLRGRKLAVQLVGQQQLASLPVGRIEPWGWDLALRAYLRRHGLAPSLMPTDEQLADVRRLSHRRLATDLLFRLREAGTVGEAFPCTTPAEVESLLATYGQVVMKAPWSSSGRGLRFLSVGRTPFSMQERWFQHVVEAQACVMVEPYYNKVKDFGVEFASDGQGGVVCLGLSLFHTVNGAYSGNVLATESAKREYISNYVPVDLLERVQENICRVLGPLFAGRYAGPFGVDMMVVAVGNGTPGFLLHPCVEVNLRRTMGHVALAAGNLLNPQQDDELRYVMRTSYQENNYKLNIRKL